MTDASSERSLFIVNGNLFVVNGNLLTRFELTIYKSANSHE